jgi:hypothetical protein
MSFSPREDGHTAESDEALVRAHIGSLLTQIAALRSERDSYAAMLCDEHRRHLPMDDGCQVCRALLEGLRWARAKIRVYYPLMRMNTAAAVDIDAEIKRLEEATKP